MNGHTIRKPQFAGSFYPDNAGDIIANMGNFFKEYPIQLEANSVKPILTMLPHAGHIYSGAVSAQTLAEVEFTQRIIILCPNHTGTGKNFGVWPDGAWQNPIGMVPTDRFLAEKLMRPLADNTPSPFVFDTTCHEKEHSIEVLLPFLQYTVPILYIIPICISRLDGVKNAAQQIVDIIKEEKEEGREVSILVSSDMNHFHEEAENIRKDKLALEAFLAQDAHSLLELVKKEKMSMCGVIPAVVGLLAANALGATQSKLVAYDTSASQSGDRSRVVGYAGAYVW